MMNLTFDEFCKAEFTLYKNNPVLKNPFNSFVVADPSLLTPDKSHDGKYHLFCHTFYGVYRYDSENGIDFRRVKRILPRAMRPNINYINGKYYLFYERTQTLLKNALSVVGGKWKSEIFVTESDDLENWSKPKLVIGILAADIVIASDKNCRDISACHFAHDFINTVEIFLFSAVIGYITVKDKKIDFAENFCSLHRLINSVVSVCNMITSDFIACNGRECVFIFLHGFHFVEICLASASYFLIADGIFLSIVKYFHRHIYSVNS